MAKETGWQQPARKPNPPQCLHPGLIFAAFSIGLHDVGHEWVCTCRTTFVVVPGDDGTKKFKEKGK